MGLSTFNGPLIIWNSFIIFISNDFNPLYIIPHVVFKMHKVIYPWIIQANILLSRIRQLTIQSKDNTSLYSLSSSKPKINNSAWFVNQITVSHDNVFTNYECNYEINTCLWLIVMINHNYKYHLLPHKLNQTLSK